MDTTNLEVTSYSDDQLYNMSDDELDRLYLNTKAEDVAQSMEHSQVETVTEQVLDNTSDDTFEVMDSDTDIKVDDNDDSSTIDNGVTESKQDNKPTKIVVKADGLDYEFTQEEILEQFPKVFPKALKFTQKLQDIAPSRKIIQTLADNNISEEDLNLLIEAKKGGREAIASLMKQNNIDAYSLDTEVSAEYKPKNYGPSTVENNLRSVLEEISFDNEYVTTYDILSNQMDTQSREAILSNPDLLLGLHADVKSGVYDKINVKAIELRKKDSLQLGTISPMLAYYAKAAQMLSESQASVNQKDKTIIEAEKKRIVQQTNIRQQADVKKAAVIPTSKAKQVINYLDDNDEDYEAWYKENVTNRR